MLREVGHRRGLQFAYIEDHPVIDFSLRRHEDVVTRLVVAALRSVWMPAIPRGMCITGLSGDTLCPATNSHGPTTGFSAINGWKSDRTKVNHNTSMQPAWTVIIIHVWSRNRVESMTKHTCRSGAWHAILLSSSSSCRPIARQHSQMPLMIRKFGENPRMPTPRAAIWDHKMDT